MKCDLVHILPSSPEANTANNSFGYLSRKFFCVFLHVESLSLPCPQCTETCYSPSYVTWFFLRNSSSWNMAPPSTHPIGCIIHGHCIVSRIFILNTGVKILTGGAFQFLVSKGENEEGSFGDENEAEPCTPPPSHQQCRAGLRLK